MFKRFSLLFVFTLILCSLSTAFAAPVANTITKPKAASTFKSPNGGYRTELVKGREDILHTNTAVRYSVGKLLVDIDSYTLPTSLTGLTNNYSAQQIKDYQQFILQIQDYPNFQFSQTTKVGANKTPNNSEGTDFTLNYSGKADCIRPLVLGSAYQQKEDRLLVVTVSAPQSEKVQATALLKNIKDKLRVNKPTFVEDNTLVTSHLGYQINLPAGWHASTLRANNVIIARSMSSVHTDEAMIRSFKTEQYKSFANATNTNINKEEKDFVTKVTKYTPNITIIRHEPVTINGLNGSIMETTNSVDLKKIFVINAYFFCKDNIGYQLRFSTDDTINYEMKLKSFKNAVRSFKEVVIEK